MVDRSSSKRCVPIRVRLAVYMFHVTYVIINIQHSNTTRVSILIGRSFSCREKKCRIEADLTRNSLLYCISKTFIAVFFLR